MTRMVQLSELDDTLAEALYALVDRIPGNVMGWGGCSAEELGVPISTIMLLREAGLVFMHQDDDQPPPWQSVHVNPERDIQWIPSNEAIFRVGALDRPETIKPNVSTTSVKICARVAVWLDGSYVVYGKDGSRDKVAAAHDELLAYEQPIETIRWITAEVPICKTLTALVEKEASDDRPMEDEP